MPKPYSHPALARFLKWHDACPTASLAARKFAANHATLAAAVKASKGYPGSSRLYWFAVKVNGRAVNDASFHAAEKATAAERANGGGYTSAYWRAFRPAIRSIALAGAAALDAKEDHGRKIAAGRRRAARAKAR